MSASARLSIPSPRRGVEDTWSAEVNPPEPPAGALSLLIHARTELHAAQRSSRPTERYVSAHLAAVRAATAVVGARSWRLRGERPTSVWRLLVDVAPELREWADYFASGSDRRAAAEAGVPVPAVVAETLLERSREFLDIVGRSVLEAPR